MEKLEQMINIYHIAFILFLVLTILFLLLSIFLFFKLNIREIYDMRTGRGARRKIQEMEEINEKTGKLRNDVVQEKYDVPENDILPQSKSEPLQEMRHTVTYQDGGNIAVSMNGNRAVEENIGMEDTSLLNDESATTLLNDESQTTLLSDESSTTLLNDESQTTLLSEGESATTLLSGENPVTFNIVKDVMLIHTDEIL